jgi:hypothetical protein
MTRLSLAIVAAALLGACQPANAPAPQASASPAAAPSAAPVQASGCAAHAVRSWEAKPGAIFTIEADTLGPDCAHAVAVMVIRKADGDPVFQWTLATQFIIGLAEAKDAPAMAAGVKDFVNDAETATTGELPEWKAGQDSPMRGEFAFMPAEGVDRAAYADLRKQKFPMFCFAQGLESMNCLALREDMFESVGFQLLPG